MREKKGLIYVYFISLIILSTLSIIVNVKDGGSIKYGFAMMLIVMLPAIYSVIPLIKDLFLDIHKSKVRLTKEVFTDRKNDLIHLLKILCSQEHRIEIDGQEEGCGKTWLAMRLCDYINNPKDKAFVEIKTKIPYKRAFYFDLEKEDTEKLDDFFRSNIISAKDVMIFDHVDKIEKLIDKQNCYHFQMVYIMKHSGKTNFSTHHISKFNVEYMTILHNKIRNTYPDLDELTKKEFDKLFELTDGNIGRISGILSEQKSINWLKDITYGKKTEYDSELEKIQIELFIGHYKIANDQLQEFKLKYDSSMKTVMDIQYKYLLIQSDCEHLLNHYKNALNILSVIDTPAYYKYNQNYEIELHKAHYYKHLWNCDEALDILSAIKNVSYAALVDSLGILAAKYFINDLHVSFTDESSINMYKDYYICANNSNLSSTQADTHKLMRYKPVYEYYANSNPDMNELISLINEVIVLYHAENNRLIANAYFIQGEIYRLYGKYDDAVISYKKCLDCTRDNNIIIQVNLMAYYLINIKKLNINFNIITTERIDTLCEDNNYADKVYHRIKCIELNDPNAHEIIKCFDSRIMPIL